MLTASVLILWMVSGVSIFAVSVANRHRSLAMWLSGWITAIAIMNTFVVLTA